ncbi:hypothetical protein CIY_32070 [Butyrivibrio fibrisolvens 16/4]|nr:hypothetical protein CIY_32070 [Butyrivibrio fibrisolvens 16/4]
MLNLNFVNVLWTVGNIVLWIGIIILIVNFIKKLKRK